jgi:hypothetical protein
MHALRGDIIFKLCNNSHCRLWEERRLIHALLKETSASQTEKNGSRNDLWAFSRKSNVQNGKWAIKLKKLFSHSNGSQARVNGFVVVFIDLQLRRR